MKVVILQSHFAKALNQVSRIVSSRTTLPVLGNILITAQKGRLTFSATDLEIGIVTQATGKIEEEGELTVPARLLSDFILNNADETIEMTTDKAVLYLKSEHYEARINGISAEEFPTIPEPPKETYCSIKKDIFLDALKKVVIAPANDETRPTLAGIYLHFSDKNLVLAATDSYRLAEKKVTLSESMAEKKMIIPTRTMTEVIRLLSGEDTKEVVISATDNQVFFTIGEVRLVSRIIEGAFPNYSQIIPTASKVVAEMDYKEILAALKMASLFAKDAANNVKIKIAEKEIAITSASVQSGGATSHLDAAVTGGETEVSFNARYLLDALLVVSSPKVTLKLNGSSSAGVLNFENDKDYLYIVMPLKVEG